MSRLYPLTARQEADAHRRTPPRGSPCACCSSRITTTTWRSSCACCAAAATNPTGSRSRRPRRSTQPLAFGHWDIVLSDYTMPQFDAMRALHQLREQSANLPFIVISGSIGEETAVAAMRAGASDYLMKANLTRLVPAIERELRESAERQERARTKKALMDLQEKFQVVFHEYLDVMLVLDLRNGHILHVNHTVGRVLGYDETRLVGQPFAVAVVRGRDRAGRGHPGARAHGGHGFPLGLFPVPGRVTAADGPPGEQGALGPHGSHHRHLARRERTRPRRTASGGRKRTIGRDAALHRRGRHHHGYLRAHFAAQRPWPNG